jgi:alpha-L-rhamnosidase
VHGYVQDKTIQQKEFMMTTIAHLLTEYRVNPLGIDVLTPRLSWQMQTERQGARQTAYQVLAASDPAKLRPGEADLWDSGKIDSDQSVHIVYGGRALHSRQRVHWMVIVWDETGNASRSETAWFELGLVERSAWKSEWIGSALRGGPRSPLPAPHLRKTFSLPQEVRAARLYVTALGVYECSVNGQVVGEDVLNPGWTDYHKRLRYQVYDVTELLRTGENAIGGIVGDGWAVGHLAWNHRQNYVDRPQLLAQLEVTLADGTTTTLATDGTWKQHFGPVLNNDLLMGEEYDARQEIAGWDQPGFDDRQWYPVQTFPDLGMKLVATNGPTIRRMEELKPISPPVDKSSFINRSHIFDLGQNMVGRIRFKGSAPANTTITLRYAEVLNPDGTLYTTNLRSARVTDYYTFKDENEEVTWEPKFTFHGFRYVELANYPGDVTADTITGIVLHSDMPQTGTFECSEPLLNQLQHNILWGQKGNFVDVPTDCPQRDERLGWTGDIQVFVRTAAYNMDVAGFMTKWMDDVEDSQNEHGMVPPVVPQVKSFPLPDGGPAWADAAVICPWTIYLCYGDTRILETSYPTMQRFLQFLEASSPGYIRCAPEFEGWPGFGDWLSINATTPRDLIGTAFFAYDARLMSQIAGVLGKTGDAVRYGKLFEDVKSAYQGRYLHGSTLPAIIAPPSAARQQMDQADAISRGNLKMQDFGKVDSKVYNSEFFTPTQTAYVLGLHFDLLPEAMRPVAATELVADIARRGQHLSTGFVGAPYLPHVLSSNQQHESAYALLHQTSWPSWLYSVTLGATTIWERWDGWTQDRGYQDPAMNSFNHYAYGSIGAWMYNTIAGIEIDPAQPGYKHIILRPQPGGGLSHARGTLKTLYGEIVSEWKLVEGAFQWTVVVPPNTTATLHIPGRAEAQEVTAGRYEIVA